MPTWVDIAVIFAFFAAAFGLVVWLSKRHDAARDMAKDNEAIARTERKRAEDAEKQRDVSFPGSERSLVDRMLARARGGRGKLPSTPHHAGNGGVGSGANGSGE